MRFAYRITILGLVFAAAACSFLQSATTSSLTQTSPASEGDALIQAGLKAYDQQHFEVAEAQFQAALEKPLTKYAPEEAQVLLGNVYKELEQYDRALEAYQKALTLNPNYHTALVNQGIVYPLLKNFDKAQESYSAALRLAPQDAHLLTSLGALSAGRRDYAKAVQYLQKSIAIEPELNVSYGNLAYTYAAMGDQANAQRYLDLAITKGYENAETLRRKIQSFEKAR